MTKRLTIYLGLLAGFAFIIYSCAKDETIINTLDDQEITTQQSQVIDGQYIVVFNEGAIELGRADISAANYWEVRAQVAEAAQAILRENRIVDRELLQTYAKVYQGIALNLDQEELARLKADRRVNFIEQDQTVHVTMGGPPGGGGGGGGQSTPWGVTRVGGPVAGANAGTAWIIDSGIDLDHPDLNVNTALSATFLGGNSTPDDQNGHGTHVAGTVAAINNDIGVVGVAAGAPVVSVRVLDRRGSGAYSGVIAGVDYVGALASNGDAANMSLGGGASSALDAAVIAASGSCPFALAAGNESTNANNSSPARANGNNVYTVSSMTSTDNWSSFSNYGNPPVDYCAPGSSIPSTYKDGGYATLSGTSMAAPHVCGILLLGNVSSDGTVNGDPDGNPDPIAHL
ncbi:S8 family serine peptidase [Lewinella sp. LCG006]|uniref:S8 family serine peptidase n=1 Tax=Lewinella sp. LCG006 TaxID=3231911 RepID=UPI003460A247